MTFATRTNAPEDASQIANYNQDKTQSDSSNESSYGQIVRSTLLVGGASSIDVLLRLVRTKVFAILLGPAGVGLIGVYYSFVTLAVTISSVGASSSGVRQIAEAASTGDNQKIARTVLTLRRVIFLFALIGASTVVLLSSAISELTFGTPQYGWAIAILAIAVFMRTLSSGQAALIQGMRRIKDIARMRIIGGLLGSVFGIAIIWVWREEGIVPLILALAAFLLLNSWWFARRIKIEKSNMHWLSTFSEAKELLSLGFAFLLSALTGALAAYVIRLIVIRELGIEASGHYSAAISLGSVYVGMIIGSMGTDFFPRLTAVIKDEKSANKMVNEQTEFSMLVSVPVIFATITLSPWIITIFYSSSFDAAGEILRWQMIGSLCRVASWPLGLILVAKGERWTFMATEVFQGILQVALVWWGVLNFGLLGAGAALFFTYLCYAIAIFIISSRSSNFRWSNRNLRLILSVSITTPLLFLIVTVTDKIYGVLFGGLLTAASAWICLLSILSNVPKNRLGRLSFLARWAKN